MLVVLTACAPKEQEFIPATHAPTMTHNEFMPGDGAKLPLRVWKPKTRTRAVMIALHGFNDYSNAFDAPARSLNRRGIAVVAFDQRGFGAGAQRGIWAGEENLTQDVRQAARAVRRQYPHTPIYLLGESMGGAVAIAALTQADAPEVDGVILSAPAAWGQDTLNPLYRLSLWFMAHTVPWMTVTGSDLRIQASDNIEMLRALSRDPLVIKETRIDAIYGLVQLMDRAYEQGGELKLPVMLLYGDKDEVIPRPPIEHLAEALEGRAKIIFYPNGYHMLLRDLQAEVVLKDVAGWVRQQRGR